MQVIYGYDHLKGFNPLKIVRLDFNTKNTYKTEPSKECESDMKTIFFSHYIADYKNINSSNVKYFKVNTHTGKIS